MKRVFSSHDTLMVDHFRNVLESSGVDCVVRNRQLSVLAGEIPFVDSYVELWVLDDGDADRAGELIASDGRSESSDSPWSCRACGEVLDGQFQVNRRPWAAVQFNRVSSALRRQAFVPRVVCTAAEVQMKR